MEYKSSSIGQQHNNIGKSVDLVNIDVIKSENYLLNTKTQHYLNQNTIEHGNIQPQKCINLFVFEQNSHTQNKKDCQSHTHAKIFVSNNKIRQKRQTLPKIQQEANQIEVKDTAMNNKYAEIMNAVEYTYKTLKDIKQKGSNNLQMKQKKSIFKNMGILQLKNHLKRSKTPATIKSQHYHPSINNSLFDHQKSNQVKTNIFLSRKTQQNIKYEKSNRLPSSHTQIQKTVQQSPKKIKLKEYVKLNLQKNIQISVQLNDKSKSKGKIYQQTTNLSIINCYPYQKQIRSLPLVNNLEEWKRRNKLAMNEKVFIITGGYRDFNLALRSRGWVQNPDCDSPCFDLKFTLQGKEINYNKLLPFQSVNHYQNNTIITTKVGLLKTLKNSMWTNDISQDTYFPKCYDLNNQSDCQSFKLQFKICKALSILKIYTQKINMLVKYSIQDEQQQKKRVQIALKVCRRNLQDLNDIIDYKQEFTIITDQQWQILSSDEISQKQLANKKQKQWIQGLLNKSKLVKSTKQYNKSANTIQNKGSKHESNIQQQNGCGYFKRNKDEQLLKQAQQILEQYKLKYAQFDLTSYNNAWILKPAGLSRGRGITCYNTLIQIQNHIKCKQSQWIAQKYIQNPLIILKRKFDIRQWVLITNFNPLTIFIYDQCYIRFSAIDYDSQQLSNKYIHLTNNSIGAYFKDFDKSHIKGNMFFEHQLKQQLQKNENSDIFQKKIKPQIHEIIKKSLQCSLQDMQNRKNSFEIFGYDFMIDDNYKVWLIEINSSPSMDYSTHVTSKLVKQMSQDLVKVVVDLPNGHEDTGKFKMIFKGSQINEKYGTAGLNLLVNGAGMKLKRPTIKMQTFQIKT